VKGLTVVEDSLPPVPEDRVAQQVRHLFAAQEKKEKDTTKMHRNRKIL
jgi:hypothetical protein